MILRKSLTPQAINSSGGPVREVQQRILKDPDYVVRDMRSLMRILVAHDLFSFSRFWVEPILRLYELEDEGDIAAIERDFEALYQMASTVVGADLAAIAPETRKGALFFAGKYLAAFATCNHGSYQKRKAEALHDSSNYFRILLEEMSEDGDFCSILIKEIASANVVVNRWNSTPAELRRSIEMLGYIRRSGYLTWAAEQMQTWPLIDKPAFNALGFASRFRLRRYYPMLLTALDNARALRAAGKKPDDNKTFRDYPEFTHPDGDYDDFRRWEKEKATKKR